MSTKRDEYLKSTPASHSEGAFKVVEIYDTFVHKRAKQYEDCDYDSQDWFDYDENLNEIETEIDMLTRHKRLPIFPKLLWVEEDGTGFAMEKAKTYDEIVYAEGKTKYPNRKIAEKIRKQIFIDLARKLKVRKFRTNVYSISEMRIGNFIELGLHVGMPYKNMLQDIYLILTQEKSNGILRDAHTGNIGFHKGHLVMFDLGQIYERCRTSFARELAPDICFEKKAKYNLFKKSILKEM